MHHGYIDKFAYQDSPVHRLDSRVKFIATILFTAYVIWLPKDSVSILICCAIWPFALLTAGNIPLGFVFKHIFFVSPFILVLAFSFPLYERSVTTVAFGPVNWSMSLGWLKFCSILCKFTVTMMALIAMVSTTRFGDLLAGLQKLGLPGLLVVQLSLLYRYIFVLIEKVQRMLRARAGRKLRNLGFKTELKIAGAMTGSLLTSGIATAEKLNIAMQARGFDGEFRTISGLKVTFPDYIFIAVTAGFLAALHFLRTVLL